MFFKSNQQFLEKKQREIYYSRDMKRVLKNFKGHKHLLFMDFEGTQFSHEMIAFGAVLVTIDKNGYIVKQKKPIKRYVRAKNAIGKFVEGLTGITQKDLNRYGVTFSQAMKDLKKYCGMAFKKSSFITFGNHDMRILGQSMSYNLDTPKDLCNIIRSNYVDFQSIISEFIRDEKGNVLSLSHYLELFGLPFDGEAHDPEYDALNLAKLYDVFMKDKDLVLNEFIKKMQNSSYGIEPINKVVKKLLSNNVVTPEEFTQLLKEYID